MQFALSSHMSQGNGDGTSHADPDPEHSTNHDETNEDHHAHLRKIQEAMDMMITQEEDHHNADHPMDNGDDHGMSMEDGEMGSDVNHEDHNSMNNGEDHTTESQVDHVHGSEPHAPIASYGEIVAAILMERGYDPNGFSVPIAQYGPALIDPALLKMDLLDLPEFYREMAQALEYDVPVLSSPLNLHLLVDHTDHKSHTEEFRSFVLDGIKEDFSKGSRTIGFIAGVIPWNSFFDKTLPESVNGLMVVIASNCGNETYTYVVNGGKADRSYVGDRHNTKYDELVYYADTFWEQHPAVHQGGEHNVHKTHHCHFSLSIYPSEEFEQTFKTDSSKIIGACVAGSFFLLVLLFGIFRLMMTRQRRFMQAKADRAEAIVASVFPQAIGERLIAEAAENSKGDGINRLPARGLLKNFLDNGQNDCSKPIADLFPSTTVLFVSTRLLSLSGMRFILFSQSHSQPLCRPISSASLRGPVLVTPPMYFVSWRHCTVSLIR